MSDLLKIRDWLSIAEAIRFLNFHFKGGMPATTNDLARLIDERKLNIYWRNTDTMCVRIGTEFDYFFNWDKHSKLKAEFLKGYFPLCIDSLQWTPCFADRFLLGLAFEPHLENRVYTSIIVRENENSNNLIAAVTLNGFSDISQKEYLTIALDQLIDELWLKKSEILNLINQIQIYSDSGAAREFQEKPLSPKTENSYLKLIQALAEYATNGLTGKPNKDAGTILAALNSKGIDCPVGDKALAGYLEKAQQIFK